MVGDKRDQFSSLRQRWINRGLKEKVFLSQAVDDFLFENGVANFDPVEIRVHAALIVDGDETIRLDTHTVPSVPLFVAVNGDHGRNAATLEPLPHLIDLHRPIVVTVHQQKTRI